MNEPDSFLLTSLEEDQEEELIKPNFQLAVAFSFL